MNHSAEHWAGELLEGKAFRLVRLQNKLNTPKERNEARVKYENECIDMGFTPWSYIGAITEVKSGIKSISNNGGE